jgi:hypothetical protein
MARGTSLLALRDQLKAEIGASPNVAMGVNTIEQFDNLLRRTQQRLWNDFDWSFALIDRDEPMINGQRYYTFDQDIDFDRILESHVKYGNIWHPIDYGIGPAQYNNHDSDNGEKTEPVVRWRHYEGNQFEVWPVPTTNNQIVRFKAVKKLAPLINTTDIALLDDTLIVLYAAAEYLARTKAADATAKLSQAQAHFNRLKGLGLKTDRFIYGGGVDRAERLRIVGGRFVRDDRPY